MGYQLWLSPYTGKRRKGTTFRELEMLFIDQITAKFVCEPLHSCRLNDDALEVKEELTKRDFDYVGVINDNDIIVGYCEREHLRNGTIGLYMKSIDLTHIITDSTPLCKLFSSLKENQFAFVMYWNKIDGIVTIWDINKPIVRIYLFGIISLFELHINFWIDSYNINGSWEKKLVPERLEGAKKLLSLRKGNNDELTLLECLQIADKKEILRDTPEFLKDFEYSKSKVKGLLEFVETIRNELAHSQNSITSNLKWDNFVDTINSIEAFLKLSESKQESRIAN